MADFSKYFRAYMNMQDILKNDFTYNYIMEGLKDGDKGEDRLDGKTNEKVIDMEWVVAIEETLPYIQKAIDEQRRFIKQVDNVVRVELAKKIGPESVKHLSQHTNFIAKVEGDMVTPNKILTIEREESFAIYENRVLMTLIRKALHFVDDKYSKMKDVPNDSYNDISMVRHINFNEKKVDFNLNYINESHETLADDLDVLDVTQLSDFDRIRKIRTTLNEFLNTQLMKEIANQPEVHPPLTQTNLLKKNPNFKKAVELWNFLDSYKRKGFEVVTEDYDGKMIVVDGYEGKVYIEPDYTTLTKMKQKQDTNVTHVKNLERLKGKENITQSGQRIDICANIGTREDIENVIRSDAGGIGLFRSEFLYMENGPKLPTEEQQFQVYKLAAESMGVKKVVIRTADLGGEKQADCLDVGHESNPTMGMRGIRISLEKEEVFKTQLRAILRASVYGNVSIMFPMITAIEEVTRAKLLLETAKRELKAEKTAFDEDIQIGVMIETPAAVMISDRLAEMVDFFSIGTNDLTQYTLAIDRQNEQLDDFYNPHHEAVLRMIRMVVENAHKCGKWAGICGGARCRSDIDGAVCRMGVDELSVAPSMILKLRKIVREMKAEE